MSAFQGSVKLPPIQHRPSGKRRMSLLMGFAAVLEADGSVVWQENDWTLNALHNAGEQSMLNVYLKEQANVSKFLALLDQPQATVVASTDVFTLNSHGYADGEQLMLGPIISGAAGITSGTVYFVRDSTTNTFKVALTSGGTAVDVTSDGTVCIIGETKGTMTAAGVVEAQTAGSAGYARQSIAAGDWTDDGLITGDYRFTAAEKTFGAVSSAINASHAALCTTATGAGLLLATLPLSARTPIANTQSLRYTFRWTNQ